MIRKAIYEKLTARRLFGSELHVVMLELNCIDELYNSHYDENKKPGCDSSSNRGPAFLRL